MATGSDGSGKKARMSEHYKNKAQQRGKERQKSRQ